MKNKMGINKLAQVLQGRMNAVVAAHTNVVCDFGVIQEDMSLLTDLFPIPLPKGSYLVCKRLTRGVQSYESEGNGGLKPSDRVLVCWVQNDAVVIDVLEI